MNKEGAIAHFETEEDARKAGYKTKLTQREAKKLMPMNRHERRKALAEQWCEQRFVARAKLYRGGQP